MAHVSTLLSILAWAGVAFTNPTPPPAPVNTVAVGPQEQLRATLTLANHQTLLFFPTLDGLGVRVVALLPTGKTAWEAALAKSAVARKARAGVMDLRDKKTTTIEPFLLTSAGSTAYAVEPTALATVVNELAADGHLTRKTFALPPPAGKAERVVLTAFADEGAVYLLEKETTEPAGTGTFFLDRCDLRTGQVAHTALLLPPAPAPARHADEYFQDWVFGGFRAGQCYFYRLAPVPDPQADARTIPVEFEVKTVGLDGGARGGFRTALHQHLPAGTFVQGGTSFPHHQQAHAPHLVRETTDPRTNSFSKMDLFELSTGGRVDFFLDPATGDGLFVGQYTNRVFSRREAGTPSLGSFAQRYGPDGTLRQAASVAYAQLPGFKPKWLPADLAVPILGSTFYAPPTQDLLLTYQSREGLLASSYTAPLAAQRPQLVSLPQPRSEADFLAQLVSWSGPSYLQTPEGTVGSSQQIQQLNALMLSPVAQYRAIGQFVDQQRAQKRPGRLAYEYTVSPTGPTTALLLEAPGAAGGTLNVYELK